MDRRIKYIERKFRRPGTNFVTQQYTNGITLKTTDKTPLEKFIIAENLKKYHQTKGTFPLLDDPRLYSDIGSLSEGPEVEALIYGLYVCPNDTEQEV